MAHNLILTIPRTGEKKGGQSVQENEIVTLLIGIAILVFILTNRQQMKRIPSVKLLVGAFGALLAGWILTNAETYFWKETLNLAEHICYATGSLCFLGWCWKIFGNSREAH